MNGSPTPFCRDFYFPLAASNWVYTTSMYNNFGPGYGMHQWFLGAMAIAATFIFIILIWSFFWKGLALWHSARRGQPWWFVIMLFVNTAGILEIIYLFGIAKLKVNELFSFKEHGHNH